MKHGRGLVAATDWTRTDQRFGLCAVVDWTWSRTSCGHGQFTDWTRTCFRTARERGLCADTDKLRSRSRTGCGHGRTWSRSRCGLGLTADADADWIWTRQVAVTVTVWSRTGCGHGLTTDADADWTWPRTSCRTMARILRGSNRDEFADNRALKIQGVRRPLLNSHKSCEPSRRILRISRAAFWPDFRAQCRVIQPH